MSKGSLDGLVVLDLTRVLAGPLSTMLLGDMGADIVKVERPATGEPGKGRGQGLGHGVDRVGAHGVPHVHEQVHHHQRAQGVPRRLGRELPHLKRHGAATSRHQPREDHKGGPVQAGHQYH